MICLSDLSELMQRAVEDGMTFMFSKTMKDNLYNLYFARYSQKNDCFVYLTYRKDKGQIIRTHPLIFFDNIDNVLDHVREELGAEAKCFNISSDSSCPYCGCETLVYDVVVDDDKVHHDVVDCPKCERRLYYEDW